MVGLSCNVCVRARARVGVLTIVWECACVGVCTCGFCNVWVCVCVGVCSVGFVIVGVYVWVL